MNPQFSTCRKLTQKLPLTKLCLHNFQTLTPASTHEPFQYNKTETKPGFLHGKKKKKGGGKGCSHHTEVKKK